MHGITIHKSFAIKKHVLSGTELRKMNSISKQCEAQVSLIY
jgi:hypothetical protein